MPFADIIGHERPKAMLQAALRQNRVGHAYLFHGEAAVGKRLTALCFAQAVNCETTESVDRQEACGHCRSCHQIETGIHPDFVLIAPDPEQTNPQIKIEEIRALEEQMIYRPLVAQRRVVLLDDADRMTLGAANALLKTLEEPPGYSMLILVTGRPYALPVTIRSRCQSVRFTAPTQGQVEAALAARRSLTRDEARFLAALTQNRIGQALVTDLLSARRQEREFATLFAPASLRSVTNVLTIAETLHREDRGPEALEWLARWIRDLILIRTGGDHATLVNLDRLSELNETGRSADIDGLLTVIEDIEAFQRAAHRNLNLQLALESILLRLHDAAFSATPAPS